MALRQVSGQKAVTQHISEMSYPTEFDPAELPNSVGLANSAGKGEEGPSLEDLASGEFPGHSSERNRLSNRKPWRRTGI